MSWNSSERRKAAAEEIARAAAGGAKSEAPRAAMDSDGECKDALAAKEELERLLSQGAGQLDGPARAGLGPDRPEETPVERQHASFHP